MFREISNGDGDLVCDSDPGLLNPDVDHVHIYTAAVFSVCQVAALFSADRLFLNTWSLVSLNLKSGP